MHIRPLKNGRQFDAEFARQYQQLLHDFSLAAKTMKPLFERFLSVLFGRPEEDVIASLKAAGSSLPVYNTTKVHTQVRIPSNLLACEYSLLLLSNSPTHLCDILSYSINCDVTCRSIV